MILRRPGGVMAGHAPAADGSAIMGTGEPNDRRRALHFLLWCLGIAAGALVLFWITGRSAAAEGAGFDPLAETALSRGAILDQLEGLGRKGGAADEPLVVTGRREVAGIGPRLLLVDAPFNISWQAESGDFAISVRRTEDDPAALARRRGERDGMRVSSRTIMRLMQSVRALDSGDYQDIGRGRGRITQTHWGRYAIRIETSGAWRLRIRHRW